ncbi:MAG: PQQ-binding-like beta-propeller repeat protein [Saprospiraceae bacterium]
MKKMLSPILPLILLTSCCKEPLPNTPPPEEPANAPKLEVLWQQPLLPDTSEHSADAHIVIDNHVISTVNFLSPSATVYARNVETGALDWTFDNFVTPVDGFGDSQVFGVNPQTLLVNKWNQTYCLDPETGSVQVQTNVSDVGGWSPPQAYVFDEYIYNSHYSGGSPYSDFDAIVRRHHTSTSWDTLQSFHSMGDTLFPITNPVIPWVSPSGDTILLTRVTYLSKGIPPLNGRLNRAHLYAYNLRTQSYEWQFKDFVPGGNMSAEPPTIDGDRMYLIGFPDLYCIDLNTGNILWKKEYEESPGVCSTIHENLLIVLSSNRGCWGLDKYTGQEVWFQPDPPGTATRLRYFDGVVYFSTTGSGRLFAINASNGELIWNEKSPNIGKYSNVGFDWNQIAIDEERRVLYACDRYFIMCIKLPEI